MLTSQLRELEHNGIIPRKVYQQVPTKVEYSMTKYGNSLSPIMISMRSWGMQHLQRMEKMEVDNN